MDSLVRASNRFSFVSPRVSNLTAARFIVKNPALLERRNEYKGYIEMIFNPLEISAHY